MSHRQSNMYRPGGSQSRTPAPPSSKKKQKQSVVDQFVIADSEIIECLSEMRIPFSNDDLLRPSPGRVFTLFESVLDQLMGIRKEVVEPLVRGGAEREDFDHPEGLHEAALLTVFFQNLQTFMVECGVSDFTFNDCLKPESDRLRFVLSSVINYVRFRAEKDPIIREYFEKAEKKRDQIEQLFTENEELKKKVLELRKRRQQEEPALQEAVNINSSLMNDLRNLRKRQAEMEEEQEKLKAEKEKLKKQLTSIHDMIQILQRECARLEPYIVDSPEKLRDAITDMATSLANERNRVESTERRSRALQNSAESFRVVEQDVNSCIKIMEDCDRELLNLEECQKKVQRHEEQVHQKEAECREIERKEERLNRMLANAKEKLDKARAQAAAKREHATKEMEALKVEYDALAKAREENIREADRKNQQIEIKKREMEELKQKIEEEVKQARIQYEVVSSRIIMYMTKMQQQMARMN